jgi:membrane-bound lytic murein transglycosylase A
MTSGRVAHIVALALSALVVAEARAANPGSLRFPDARLEPAAWHELDGWTADDHAQAFATFLASCRAILGQTKPAPSARRFIAAMQGICRRAREAGGLGAEEVRDFFEQSFLPLRIAKVDDPMGFLTGYYEPIVAGSRFPTPEYTVPMYRRPADAVLAGARKRKGGMANKGKVVRRVGKKWVPYFDRAEIEDGALDGRHLEICWLKDPIDAFFIHIQGSARVRLEDGAVLRLNYEAHNGHRYLPVGKVLIDRGEVAKEDMSMDRIRQWMLASPDGGRELRRMNKSYIFFRVTGLKDHEEAVGAQGVPLMAGRSIAIDRHLHLYGTLFWIEADLPIASEVPDTKFRRLMVGQDTGSAIVGPARADIYFGAGDEAGRVGGRIKHPGRFVMLVPRELDPFAKWRNVPMPPIRGEAMVSRDAEPVAVEVEPVPAPKPAPRKTAARPAGDKPETTRATPKPSTAQPSAAKPSTAKKTVMREPAAKPSPGKPASGKPAGGKPAATKPAAAKPAATTPLSGLARLFSSSKPDTKPAGNAAKPKAPPKAAKPKPKSQASARQP